MTEEVAVEAPVEVPRGTPELASGHAPSLPVALAASASEDARATASTRRAPASSWGGEERAMFLNLRM
jgi:hypothetical protein